MCETVMYKMIESATTNNMSLYFVNDRTDPAKSACRYLIQGPSKI